MKKNILYLLILFIFSCKKETITEVSVSESYDFTKDSCGGNLLKGVYVSTTNNIDTLVITNYFDNTDSTKLYGNMMVTFFGGFPLNTRPWGNLDMFQFCCDKDSILISRLGLTKPYLPDFKVKYTLKKNVLTFDKITFQDSSFNDVEEDFILIRSIDNKSFRKVK